MSLELGCDDGRLAHSVATLALAYGPPVRPPWPVDPVTQLVDALISTRTRDEVSRPALARLVEAFPDWATLIDAELDLVVGLLGQITRPEVKARQLRLCLLAIRRARGALELDFLGDHSVEAATQWLCGLPGVGPKVAAETLNFSWLNRRTLVVDTHVHRVARRMGLTAWSYDETRTQAALMGSAPSVWEAEDFTELNAQFRRLGQRACLHAAPLCELCPVAMGCPKVGVEGAEVLTFSPMGAA